MELNNKKVMVVGTGISGIGAYDYSGTVADNGKTYTVQNGFVIA